MSGNFERAIDFVIKQEGGYVNNPADPGGETNYGISKKAYPALDIKNLSQDAAKEIYKKDYWSKAGCESAEWPMCVVILDAAVQHGVSRALEFKTLARDWTDFIFLRIKFYSSLKRPVFMCGWMNRMVELYRICR
ncbi:MAG: hypothetical protein HZB80_11375 [Deltaproteobacteria bacterium]|nr:hypothetical protein [Deltaproteobacteria bacterium]